MVWFRAAEAGVARCWPTVLLAAVSVVVAVPAVSAIQFAGPSDGQQYPVVVYLVRHAERVPDGTDDPRLTLAGEIRARMLLQLLSDARLTHIHTTDWRRTRHTVRPLTERLGMEAIVYDPRELEAFAATLRNTPGRHLVAGHSNTTPMLVAALGGDPFGPIADMEYDRLYIVVITPGHPPVTALLRYGEPYVEGSDFGLRAERSSAGSLSSRHRN